MASTHSLFLLFVAIFAFLTSAEGFWLSSSKPTAQERKGMPPHLLRDMSHMQQLPWMPQQPYHFDNSGPVTVALPVAVPIQAKMAPLPPSLQGTVHNVQLVPCLCPVSRDQPEPAIQQQQQQQQQQIQQQQLFQPFVLQNQQTETQA